MVLVASLVIPCPSFLLQVRQPQSWYLATAAAAEIKVDGDMSCGGTECTELCAGCVLVGPSPRVPVTPSLDLPSDVGCPRPTRHRGLSGRESGAAEWRAAFFCSRTVTVDWAGHWLSATQVHPPMHARTAPETGAWSLEVANNPSHPLWHCGSGLPIASIHCCSGSDSSSWIASPTPLVPFDRLHCHGRG